MGEDTSQDEEIVKKAKLLADATGRSFEDVLEDLLDDGELNNSNTAKADLVTQLKEAAELITTVQAISQEVSENTVLNGGDNKTEVKVESTLEGDIVDRAIESVQRKADNIKKLAATLIPVFLLLTGGSMEAFGIIDVFGSDDYEEPYYEEVWGCTNYDALNYDPMATNDDGSCQFDNGNGGTIPPPSCDESILARNWDYVINDNEVTLFVDITRTSQGDCPKQMEVFLHYDLFYENAYFATFDNIRIIIEDGNTEEHSFTIPDELDEGDWEIDPRTRIQGQDEVFHEPYGFYIESDEPDCVPDWWWKNEAIFDHDHDGQGFNNDLRVQVDFQDLNACNEHMNNGYFEIEVGDDVRVIEQNFHNQYTINEHYLNLDAGDYLVKISYHTYDGSHWGGPEAWVTMESEPAPSQDCSPYLYSLNLAINTVNSETEAVAESDMDCSASGSEEVSVWFAVYENGSDMTEAPLASNFDNYSITGSELDIKSLKLTNFEVTHNNLYDFYWSVYWETDSGSYQDLSHQWFAVEIGDIEQSNETDCSNLTLNSNSLTLSAEGSDLSLDWDLRHDGINDQNCFMEIEVMVTLYQNGSYYNVSEFHENGVHKIYANSSLILDKSSVSLFASLPDGEYEILIKYRINGTTDASHDYFANKVFITTSSS